MLNNLINWAEELNYSKIVLETGKNQPEAISLYQKTGFVRIKNYGPYTNIENSLCFEKIIH